MSFVRAAGYGLSTAVLFGACHGRQSALAPHGPAASSIMVLLWVLLAVCGVFAVVVLMLLARAAFARRSPVVQSEARAMRWLVVGGAALPAVVVTALFVYSVVLLGALTHAPSADLTVEVVGHQWWWSVRYLGPDSADVIVSANELHIPVGRRVSVRLSSPDVIHSFWVPALHGKTDLIPGRVNTTWIQADEPGVYRGQCAEFCGLQHARMAFLVIAHPEAEFASWLARERMPADSAPAERAGYLVFQQSCAVCHAVRGTPARGVIGPDLTHLAGRRTLAAGTLPNGPGPLSAWIANPQALKRGNHMPRLPLSSAQLQALVAYLQTLR